MITPPRRIEAVLESLGATAPYRDAIVGDLAEEFAERAERDGVRAARRWYLRETLRAAPHLLRDWTRALTPRDARHLAGVAFSAYVLAGVTTVAVASILRALLLAMHVPLDLRHAPLVELYAGWVVLNGIASAIGGYVAASLHARAPMAGALALGLLWTVVDVTALALLTEPSALRTAAVAATLLTGAIAGGILRTSRLPHASVNA